MNRQQWLKQIFVCIGLMMAGICLWGPTRNASRGMPVPTLGPP